MRRIGPGRLLATVVVAGALFAPPASALEVFREDFEAVSPPALPSGWTTSSGWETTATAPVGGSTSAFAIPPSTVSDQTLVTPPIALAAAPTTLEFRHTYSFGAGNDGGVLEVSIDGGASWIDVAVGGTFDSGGYTGSITDPGNPLFGRSAWTGPSGPAVLTSIQLAPAVLGQTVHFRFRLGTNASLGGGEWKLDDLVATDTLLPLAPAPAVAVAAASAKRKRCKKGRRLVNKRGKKKCRKKK